MMCRDGHYARKGSNTKFGTNFTEKFQGHISLKFFLVKIYVAQISSFGKSRFKPLRRRTVSVPVDSIYFYGTFGTYIRRDRRDFDFKG